jgi:hypothetical protein
LRAARRGAVRRPVELGRAQQRDAFLGARLAGVARGLAGCRGAQGIFELRVRSLVVWLVQQRPGVAQRGSRVEQEHCRARLDALESSPMPGQRRASLRLAWRALLQDQARLRASQPQDELSQALPLPPSEWEQRSAEAALLV